jgi:hypothetical protein
MKPARGKKINRANHDDNYWRRLKEQFATCSYDHSGAYRQYGNGRSRAMRKMAKSIDKTEKILQGEKYRELLADDHFKPCQADCRRKPDFFKDRLP